MQLRGTTHLWVAGGDGVLHWAGDTKALAGQVVNWGSRREVALGQLAGMQRGDPWLSAGLLKMGDPIYLVKWEADWPQPQLLHIQSVADMELFGIGASNYSRFVLDPATWQSRYGMDPNSLTKGSLAPVTGAVETAGATTANSPSPSGVVMQSIDLSRNTSVDGFVSDTYGWTDSAGRRRSAALVRNDMQDPEGKWGGYLRRYVYDVDGSPRVANGAHGDYPGFGMTINHFEDTWYGSHFQKGTGYGPIFVGRHHAIHEFKARLSLGGTVNATIHWFFATGRDHPVWAVTFDSSPAGPNAVKADTRAPYGELLWDGGAGSAVDGIEWGDHYKFKTVSAPLSFQSKWDYTQPNTVPYDAEWTAQPDSEMGLVQTQTYTQHDAGGFQAYHLWGKTSGSPDLPQGLLETGGIMPAAWNWTYQLNQWEIPYQLPKVVSRRLAWGTNHGAVGQTEYLAYGDGRKLSGYPYQSYSVFVVLGKHSATPTAAQVNQVEMVQNTRLVAHRGAVVTAGPAGIARPDSVSYDPPGYNHIYGTWEVSADQHVVELDLNVSSGALQQPIFVVHNYGAGLPPSRVTVNGQTKTADVDYFASVDAGNRKLWLTLKGAYSGSTRIQIGA